MSGYVPRIFFYSNWFVLACAHREEWMISEGWKPETNEPVEIGCEVICFHNSIPLPSPSPPPLEIECEVICFHNTIVG